MTKRLDTIYVPRIKTELGQTFPRDIPGAIYYTVYPPIQLDPPRTLKLEVKA